MLHTGTMTGRTQELQTKFTNCITSALVEVKMRVLNWGGGIHIVP